ncbi:UDP-N-acetylmuramate dehydrogenase [Aquimarina brevivitae]|uniref:UDP-N-acetylenolpyruvoylglucosamine reductase n=1 Tax=Aquimarina brevivitae TaxID=323412 RepID=A0A4Q7PM80_9FLAO|nr:UDP-N-acetylmuramate dehydrogenase [Aquimarina brevivitae]RZT00103.1 UDP-N-acetylmuramate dehydrogenase [Aquimarina brevivitae]
MNQKRNQKTNAGLTFLSKKATFTPMIIEKNKSLKSYNTFGIEVKATEFVEVTTEEDLLRILLQYQGKPIFILSGGSNMLLTKDIEALVIHIKIEGITTEKTDDQHKIRINVGAGESWHDFVLYCIKNNFGGVENLSLIPGYVGSAPIQNIGAYGVELKDTFHSCQAIEVATGKRITFTKEDCQFGYRDSIFKRKAKNKYIITQVSFVLTTQNHQLHTAYGAITAELAKNNISQPTIQNISDAVIAIRKSKLPNPKEIGNSGSFFKNPVISKAKFNNILKAYPNAPSYVIDENSIKVPAGWLIEQCGFKGKRWGDAGIHKNQALVLVNYANATGSEIKQIAENIKETIKSRFDISLESEVNIF